MRCSCFASDFVDDFGLGEFFSGLVFFVDNLPSHNLLVDGIVGVEGGAADFECGG